MTTNIELNKSIKTHCTMTVLLIHFLCTMNMEQNPHKDMEEIKNLISLKYTFTKKLEFINGFEMTTRVPKIISIDEMAFTFWEITVVFAYTMVCIRIIQYNKNF